MSQVMLESAKHHEPDNLATVYDPKTDNFGVLFILRSESKNVTNVSPLL